MKRKTTPRKQPELVIIDDPQTQAPPARQPMPVHIRWMIRRDMPEVCAIEAASFEFPWSEEDFIRCLRQRNCIGMVAEHAEQIRGFMVYELHKNRLHILNFAVDPIYRRLKIGEQMIDKVKTKLLPQRRNRILLEVRETNLGAQLFWRSMGFRAISLLRDFYDDTPEDAYLMQYRYSTPDGGQAVLQSILEGDGKRVTS